MSLALALQSPTLPFTADSAVNDAQWFTTSHQDKVLQNLPWFARQLLSRLRRMEFGQLLISLPNGARYGIGGDQPGYSAKIRLYRWQVLNKIFWDGDLGLAQAYIDGDWHTDDLPAVLGWGAQNAAKLFGQIGGHGIGNILRLMQHAGRRNSKSGSKRNIMAHYDLGNEFYSAWLDPSMTYSSAIFSSPGQDLSAAQTEKYRRLLQSLCLPKKRQHILEIGCGWGGFVEHVLQHTDHQITAVTISPAQHAFALERIASLNGERRARIELRDYRDLTGQYDGIVSIEMFEAVGEKYWPVYARQLQKLLKPKARAALQMITIADDRFDAYRRTPDFIQQFIFPGGMLISDSKLAAVMAKAGLQITASTKHGADYAETLRRWRQSFHAAWPKISSRAFDARFKRLWDYYLCYCEAGFNHGLTDLAQVRIERAA
jgi:cyclopropane-fatty-acyl-phospholipid synthase